MNPAALLHPILALSLAPLLLGIINRTKAYFGGRCGPPLAQPYFDLWKLLHKGAVYSRTTTWIFPAGPIVTLAATMTALLLVPFAGLPAVLWFSGDFLLFAYLLALARFFTIAAALDTGSAFEGMGASREALFSILAEPALLLGLAAILREMAIINEDEISFVLRATGEIGNANAVLSLSNRSTYLAEKFLVQELIVLMLVALALFVVLLVETCRIPADDPNTHLELTMIHEVMVLDHGGPDLAFILYAAALKLWLLGSLLISVVLPRFGMPVVDGVLALLAMFLLAVLIGIVESSMARLRLLRVPQMLVGAAALAALALVLQSHGGRM